MVVVCFHHNTPIELVIAIINEYRLSIAQLIRILSLVLTVTQVGFMNANNKPVIMNIIGIASIVTSM